MPFPLIAAAIGAAGSLGGALMNRNAANNAAGVSKRAGKLASQASLKAGSMGAGASKKAAAVGSEAALKAAGVGSEAALKAAQQQVHGYNNAIDQTRTGTAQSIGYLAPYNTAGQGGMRILSDALGVNGPEAQANYYKNFQTDPGFEATQRAGIGALDQSSASGGLLRSGGAAKELYKFGEQSLQGQFQDRLTRLMNMGTTGLTAATNMGNFAQTGSRDIAGYLSDIGGANATGTINAGNATMGGITGAADYNVGGILGAANANIGGMLGAANARTGAMQNASMLNQYGAGQMASGISDLAGRFSAPLSNYVGTRFA